MTQHDYTALLEQRKDLFAAAYNALAALDFTAATELGPDTFDEIDYPYAEVMPDTLTYQGASEYEHTFQTNLYFVRKRHETYLDILSCLVEATTAVAEALQGVECTVTVRPTEVRDYAGEDAGDLMIMVSTTWTVTAADPNARA